MDRGRRFIGMEGLPLILPPSLAGTRTPKPSSPLEAAKKYPNPLRRPGAPLSTRRIRKAASASPRPWRNARNDGVLRLGRCLK